MERSRSGRLDHLLRGATRLVEYLQYVGYNGLVMTVLADGSTIYPSQLLQPTPRYDTGALFRFWARIRVARMSSELLFRLCDREGLQLIPALQFAAPLPALEEELRHKSSADTARHRARRRRRRRGWPYTARARGSRRTTTRCMSACRTKCCPSCANCASAISITRPFPAWHSTWPPTGMRSYPARTGATTSKRSTALSANGDWKPWSGRITRPGCS